MDILMLFAQHKDSSLGSSQLAKLLYFCVIDDALYLGNV